MVRSSSHPVAPSPGAAVSSVETLRAQYTARSKAWRLVQCVRAVPDGLRAAALVWPFIRRAGTDTDALPAFLDRLTERFQPGTLHPCACSTVAHRLMVRTHAHRCLPRSLMLYGLLHRTSLTNIQFCLGVDPNGVASRTVFAHAWVAVNGVPFAEATDPRRTHRVLFRHPPASSPAAS